MPLQQAWKSVWMSCVSFTLWWGRGRVLDVWAPVDLTEQSASNAATGSTMQGHTTLLPSNYCACVHLACAKLILGIPANPKRDHHWVKAKSSKSVFCQHIFNSTPKFFAHHQMDLAQFDGKKMLLVMITAVSRILCLDFDFPENYTHINQVSNIVCTFPNQSRHVCVH